jgi:hypothetical protein
MRMRSHAHIVDRGSWIVAVAVAITITEIHYSLMGSGQRVCRI